MSEESKKERGDEDVVDHLTKTECAELIETYRNKTEILETEIKSFKVHIEIKEIERIEFLLAQKEELKRKLNSIDAKILDYGHEVSEPPPVRFNSFSARVPKADRTLNQLECRLIKQSENSQNPLASDWGLFADDPILREKYETTYERPSCVDERKLAMNIFTKKGCSDSDESFRDAYWFHSHLKEAAKLARKPVWIGEKDDGFYFNIFQRNTIQESREILGWLLAECQMKKDWRRLNSLLASANNIENGKCLRKLDFITAYESFIVNSGRIPKTSTEFESYFEKDDGNIRRYSRNFGMPFLRSKAMS